jgi:outer membrane protein assembly factor BamA
MRFALLSPVLGFALLFYTGTVVSADTNIVPVPAIATSKNDGSDFGLIVPLLVTGPDGDLEHLIAPMLVYNTIVGPRATINWFRYEPGGRELRFIASYAQKIERELTFSYTDPALSNGRYSLNFGASFFKNATARFFGLGRNTALNDQTNYTAPEIRANWKFGLYANEVTQIAVSQRFRNMATIQQGATSLPFTLDAFPTTPGVNGATILGERVSFHYDTRDHLLTPTDGTQITVYAEINNNFKDSAHPMYSRYEMEVKKLLPSESKRAILVLRADIQATIGTNVPFYEQSSLGGQNNLRGYGASRFIDKNLVSASIEERLHVLRTRLAGVTADFEVAPFLDTGQVFNDYTDTSFKSYRMTPGVGFRGIVRPNVVGRVDYGYSREGGAVFAGLDFPF